MPAYVVAESTMRDDDEIRRYREVAAETIRRHGGRYLARGATPVVLEGEWAADDRVVIIEFPSFAQARAWYTSREYRDALAARTLPLQRRLLLVDGIVAHR